MRKTDVERSLKKQLAEKGADIAHFQGLINDYIFLYGMVEKMKKDIRKRGAEYEAISAAGKPYIKENPAIKNIVIYNRQMLAILKELGLTTSNADAETDDEL